MLELTGEQKSQYYHRSYTAVDGLWFMKVEEKYGFNAALNFDDEVWKVMPKIQARWLKSVANADLGMEALFRCFTTKLKLDECVFSTERLSNGFSISITDCSWYNLLVKSNREHISDKIGARICVTEASVWAAEFGDDIYFTLEKQLCRGENTCIFRFTEKDEIRD